MAILILNQLVWLFWPVYASARSTETKSELVPKRMVPSPPKLISTRRAGMLFPELRLPSEIPIAKTPPEMGAITTPSPRQTASTVSVSSVSRDAATGVKFKARLQELPQLTYPLPLVSLATQPVWLNQFPVLLISEPLE